MPDKADVVMDLAKRRGLLWPSFEAYGGVAGFYDYGPLGALMKRRFEDLWRHIFVTTEATPMAEVFCPRVTPEPVLVASGHVAEFTDLVVKCSKGHPSRADHLVAAAGYTGNPGTLAPAEIDAQIALLGAKCPVCGDKAFSPAARQNLMNQTEIGPGSGRVGYLRPETAQGIFTDFPLLLRHFRDRLPFGVVQVGGSNRNEISPRQGMLRLREFSMMEAEVFYDPQAKSHPRFADVADQQATFVPQGDGKDHLLSFREAVAKGLVANEALAYWLARTQEFLVAAGVDPKRLHFRQHLKGEMAHYAADCWDAEFHSERFGWVECVGVADRGSYDLGQHALHSGDAVVHPVTGEAARKPNLKFHAARSKAKPREAVVVRNAPNLGELGKRFKKDAKAIAFLLDEQFRARCAAAGFDVAWPLDVADVYDAKPVPGEAPAEAVRIRLRDAELEVPHDCVVPAQVRVSDARVAFVPCVIEPSFGVDRILYAIWEHAYEATRKEGEEYVRMRIPARVAPIQAAVLPLTGKDGLPEKAQEIAWSLRKAGLTVDYDETGNIGRRYARQDEVGTPFCLTIDNESLQDNKVTVRERDTTRQERIAVDRLAEHLAMRLK